MQVNQSGGRETISATAAAAPIDVPAPLDVEVDAKDIHPFNPSTDITFEEVVAVLSAFSAKEKKEKKIKRNVLNSNFVLQLYV